MSRQQARHYRPLSSRSLTELRLLARLTTLRRAWSASEPHYKQEPDWTPCETLRPYVALLSARQNGRCAYCCRDLEGLRTHVDHIVPRSKGGLNRLDNYALTCVWCNITKKDTSAMDFAIRLLTRGK